MVSQVVVPSYRLVWYNSATNLILTAMVVVPSYRLVWYNIGNHFKNGTFVVVPSYRLVWYNRERKIPVFITFTGIFHVKKDGKSFFFVSKIILFSKNIY